MMDTMDTPRPVDALIEKAAQKLEAEYGNQQDGMLFVGTRHDAYPALLIHDPFLPDSAKIQFLYLLQQTKRQTLGPIAMPSASQTAKSLGHSRRLVLRDRLLLRITRWISLCRRVRTDQDGKARGHIHAIHSEPCPLSDATHFDAGYMRLLEENERSSDSRLRCAAASVLKGIDHNTQADLDPFKEPDLITRRMKAAESVERGEAHFFGVFGDEKSLGNNFAPGDLDEKSLGNNFAPGDFSPEGSCNIRNVSKYVSKTYLLTNTDVDYEEPVSSLIWPHGFDNDNLRVQILRLLKGIPADYRQPVLNQLGYKAQDQSDPLRRPVPYVASLCRQVQAGTFDDIASATPWRPPTQTSPASPASDPDINALRDLRSEIHTLETLLAGKQSDAARNNLQAQLDRARNRLQALGSKTSLKTPELSE